METIETLYIYKETMKDKRNYNCTVQLNKIFEAVLKGEGHMM
jgi:hypothetical protein